VAAADHLTGLSDGPSALLWRRYRSLEGQLRIGLLLESVLTESWVANLLSLLFAEPAIRIDTVFFLNGAATPCANEQGPSLFRLLHTWSLRAAAPTALVDIQSQIQGVATALIRLDPSGDIHPEDRRHIAERQLDVLVLLDHWPLSGDCTGLARFGVWSLHLGDPSGLTRCPPYWREVYDKDPISAVVLQLHSERFENAKVLHRYVAATQQGWSFTRNAVEPLTMAGLMLARRLLDVLEYGYGPLIESVQEEIGSPIAPSLQYPSNLEAARFIFNQAHRSIARRLQARGRQRRWYVAIRSNRQVFTARQEKFTSYGFCEVPVPEGHAYADPFVAECQGRNWLFVEELPRNSTRGRLTCLEVLKNGSFAKPFVVLEKPYHISYPFIVQQGEDFFLLPESGENYIVELYRATRFPYEWQLEKVLCEGMPLVDTTPFYLNGTWYFFTTTFGAGMETFLFYATSLDGEWHYHPRNPICSDVRRARSAGALFYRNGRLIRPTQDCSVRYGYAIVLNEVLRISTREYEDRVVEVIYPNWTRGLSGTHTLNSSADLEVIDGLRF
jgi:hypothetical protein